MTRPRRLNLHYTLICDAVPSPPTGVTFVPFGTADIQIRWAMPNPDTVRGPGPTFYVQLFDDGTLQGELQVDELSVVMNASVGVVSRRVQDIVVSYVHTQCIKPYLINASSKNL